MADLLSGHGQISVIMYGSDELANLMQVDVKWGEKKIISRYR